MSRSTTSRSIGGCSGSARCSPDAARPLRHATGDRWFVDETYVKVAGRWRYLYRAVDQYGQVIDVLLSEQRDTAAARRFFVRALGSCVIEVVDARLRGPAGRTGRSTGSGTNSSAAGACLRVRGGRQILRLVLRPVTVAAIMTRIAATMMLMIHRIQSMPFVASTPSAAAT